MTKDKYWLMGPVYDALSWVFAGNSIYQCKCSMLNEPWLKPGDRVLFAGVGHGKEAIYAAERGAKVTVVDLSEAMLSKFRDAVAKTGKDLDVRIIHADIFKVEEFGEYDMVTGNFFFNLFPREMIPEVLDHLKKLARKDGYIVISDFAYPQGNPLAKLFKNAYWYTAILIFWATTGAAIHPVYDYRHYMVQAGLKMRDLKHTPFLGINAYTSMLGQRLS
ncbi:methyltransferase domain-containing protein [Marinobacter salinisoli]|uniref:Methyltransferase domain-containing protein n=1 Tax=Marinobacter salinisoli TaxID=2769486 RepID=A0ABX7MRU2_9GAMM|nr:class I SAM-dependent methyltransferase [Marinobacter salinisoli]QSP95097.1 methyltransferase domain-containing protein [Marinobacter salinisoli]